MENSDPDYQFLEDNDRRFQEIMAAADAQIAESRAYLDRVDQGVQAWSAAMDQVDQQPGPTPQSPEPTYRDPDRSPPPAPKPKRRKLDPARMNPTNTISLEWFTEDETDYETDDESDDVPELDCNRFDEDSD